MKALMNAAPTRRQMLGLLAGAGAVAAATPSVAAPTILRGVGNIRTIRLENPRTGDSLASVYWVDGQYIPEVLAEINHLMRDWRTDQKKQIDPALIDIAAATHAMLNTNEPFTVFSGFRSPTTNRMLASRSRSVATDSYHVKGMAADLHLKSRSVRQMSTAALKLGVGGVGRYSRSNFVHLDSGPPRDWGR